MTEPTAIAPDDEDGPRLVLIETRAITEGADAPLGWVVPGFVGEGLTILAGRQKVGKSWLAMDWATAVAAGGRAMRAVECEQGDALYVDLENGRRRLRARLDTLCPGPPDLPRLRWASDAPPLGKGLVEALEHWRSGVARPRLVVIDAAQKPGWKAGAAGDVVHLTGLQRWATASGVGVVWLHRMRKVGDPLVALGGSGGVFGFADAMILLDRDDAGATLQMRGRDGEDRHAALAFAAGAWSLAGEAPDRQSGERRRILEALEASDAPMAPKDVAETLGMRHANVRMTMSRMARDGELTRTGHGLYQSARAARKEAEDKALFDGLWEGFVQHCARNAPPGAAPVNAVPGLREWLQAPPPGAGLRDMPGFMEWLDAQE